MTLATENPWQTISSCQKYENPWIQVTEHQVLNPKGGPGIYGVVHFKNLAIGAIPMDPDLNIWLVGQYRYPLNQYSWEIPEGGGPLNIDPLLSAQRELQEETGIIAHRWLELFRMHLSNSVSDELAIVFLAQDLTFGQSTPEDTEDLQIQKVSLKKAAEMVNSGEITDSLTVAAIFKLQILAFQGAFS